MKNKKQKNTTMSQQFQNPENENFELQFIKNKTIYVFVFFGLSKHPMT